MPSESAQSLYSTGLAAFKATSFETALQLFTEAINLEPTSAKLYDARASVNERLGNLQDGLLDARQVVKLLPTSSKGYLRASKMLKAAKKFANAEKIVRQGLQNVATKDEKGIASLEAELATLTDLREKAEFCPFSNLPLEIFLEIVTLATLPPPTSNYTMKPIPRSRIRPPNPLLSAMRVCRTWCRIIKGSPQLWQTLRLDGAINEKNAEKKARTYLRRALGQGEPEGNGTSKAARTIVRHPTLTGSSTALGIQRLVITAAQDLPSPTFTAILDLLRDSGVTSTLREVVLSFVDGSRTTISNEREASISTELLVFLQTHSRDCLTSLSICTGGRCYPDFDLTSMYIAFPQLESFNIWGNTTSGFILGLRAPFLLNGILTPSSTSDRNSLTLDRSSSTSSTASLPATNARRLAITGSVLVADSTCHLPSFPHLESLELDLIGASIIWELLSAPNLSRFQAVIYGENHILELPLPNLSSSWARIEDLRIGGAKHLAARFLEHAISLTLDFKHLVRLDLSYSSLSTHHLELFSSAQAPLLEYVNLASTTTAAYGPLLTLPDLSSVKELNLSHTLWTNDSTIRKLVTTADKLEKLQVVGNAFVTGRPLMELVLARMPPRRDEGQLEMGSGKESKGGAGVGEKRLSEIVELRLEGCDKIETAAVDWLRQNMKPGAVKFQFVDPADRRGRWERIR